MAMSLSPAAPAQPSPPRLPAPNPDGGPPPLQKEASEYHGTPAMQLSKDICILDWQLTRQLEVVRAEAERRKWLLCAQVDEQLVLLEQRLDQEKDAQVRLIQQRAEQQRAAIEQQALESQHVALGLLGLQAEESFSRGRYELLRECETLTQKAYAAALDLASNPWPVSDLQGAPLAPRAVPPPPQSAPVRLPSPLLPLSEVAGPASFLGAPPMPTPSMVMPSAWDVHQRRMNGGSHMPLQRAVACDENSYVPSHAFTAAYGQPAPTYLRGSDSAKLP
eukprot:gnl/TRDRNA2_/TRDRNA2_197943_c0_seq1.p1 gnl/TRDRNA2_/TRDRNA2_197943_c0~~gnl/TRDRNA2_/TRDRNA2_197943_c0_seq1.p1  ORF type:complete len:277 (+),score=53.56 gnl/TRDRNA2_/TRDRNA2_197943_c0_seq1:36-866(+)